MKEKLRLLFVCVRGEMVFPGIIGLLDQYWCYDKTLIEFVVLIIQDACTIAFSSSLLKPNPHKNWHENVHKKVEAVKKMYLKMFAKRIPQMIKDIHIHKNV